VSRSLVTVGVSLWIGLGLTVPDRLARAADDCESGLPLVAARAEIESRMDQRVRVCGVLRVFDHIGPARPMPATQLVLTDGARIIVTYGRPPVQWDRFVDQPICVRARLVKASPLHPQSVAGPHLSEWDFPVLQAAEEGSMAPVDLSKQLDRRVTLQGVAENAKGGAVLVIPKDNPIYIEGLDSWPDDILGSHLSATGVLRRMQYLPEVRIDPDGAISQGTFGKQYVLVEASWIQVAKR
jgi:hypothetical protein